MTSTKAIANIQKALKSHKVRFATQKNIIGFFVEHTKETYRDEETGEVDVSELLLDIANHLQKYNKTSIEIDPSEVEI